MPVLPEVASRIVLRGVSAPDASPSRIIRAAARSFTDPPGFCHSAFAYSSTPGVSRSKVCRRTSGVRPIMSSTVGLGSLIDTGPFGFVRNPLYIGNIALWAGFALTARLAWLAPAIAALLGREYHAMVRWEERLLESRLGTAYRDYAARVPRWIPAVI